MNPTDLKKTLCDVAAGRMSPDDALKVLRDLPFKEIGDIVWDSHRTLRRGIPESVYAPGKTIQQIINALEAADASGVGCVVTRIDRTTADGVIELFRPDADATRCRFHETARLLTLQPSRPVPELTGKIVIVTAGTSDRPVAEEAATTLKMAGDRVDLVQDVGIAGIHRITPHLTSIREASAVIVVAGMEGALPGVVAALTSTPVIGVPTSVGYGTAFGGITALLTMLNSCSGGLTVVNIDNGFGAAVAAHLINAGRQDSRNDSEKTEAR